MINRTEQNWEVGEVVPEFGCNKKTLYAIADTMIEKLRGCGESAALVRQAIDERDALLQALTLLDQAENGPWDGDEQQRHLRTAWAVARALFTKHER